VGVADLRIDAARMKIFSLLTFTALSFVAPPCHAEETKSETKNKTTWYGWQTLLVDGGTVATTVATGQPLVFVGGMTFGAPIVHWAHGNVLQGFASLGLRVIAPIVVGSAAFALDGGPSDGRQGERAFAVGLLGGGLFASLFDAIVLARSPASLDTARNDSIH
jgi:hypothetical protein